MPTKKKHSHQIHPRLTHEMFQRVHEVCAAKKMSLSQIVELALKAYLDADSDMTLLFRQQERTHRAATRIERDLHLVSEALGVYIQSWYTHAPLIPESDKDLARKRGWMRYQKYCEAVAYYMGKGHRFIDDLVRDTVGNDNELAAAVSNPTPAPQQSSFLPDPDVLSAAVPPGTETTG